MTITRLIKTDADANNNKFWEAVLEGDGNTVRCRWGRVGATGQSKTFAGGQRYIDKKVREKTAEGYVVAKVMEGGQTAKVDNVAAIARQQITTCKESARLVDELVAWNIHNITQHSTLTVNISSGSICLPSGLGVLTQAAIDEARDVLRAITQCSRSDKPAEFKGLINKYLTLVPQIVPRERGWIEHIYSQPDDITRQEQLLDSLQATIQSISTTPCAEKVFDLELTKLPAGDSFSRIKKLYESTRQSMHQAYRLEPVNAYAVHMRFMRERYNKCMVGNPMELWHGTPVGNLLSILKSGLVIPKHAAHGRMFGDGAYFSDQSTKALNYAAGYWSGNYNRRCFMFLANVRMGRPYTPSAPMHASRPPAGYDSVFAKAHVSGVQNNEMVVFDLSSIDLTHLIEFSER